MRFCDRLREQRKRMDMTQEQVAKSLNIVRSTYAYYETGKTCPDFSTVVRLAHLFNVTTDYLLDANAPDPQFSDNSNAYSPSRQKAIRGEWSLRESEQKLVMAFRYLDKDTQASFLRAIEKAATDQYEQRRASRQKKNGAKKGAETKETTE